jgi:hypothetical protein
LVAAAYLGEAAKFPFPIHPHMLRHATGYKLANDGRDTCALQHYLGLSTAESPISLHLGRHPWKSGIISTSWMLQTDEISTAE